MLDEVLKAPASKIAHNQEISKTDEDRYIISSKLVVCALILNRKYLNLLRKRNTIEWNNLFPAIHSKH